MKGLYIASITKNRPRDLGVLNKIYGQLDGFKSEEVDMDFIFMKDNYIYRNNEKIKMVRKNNSLYFFKRLCEFFKGNCDEYKFVYIRYSVANIFLLKLCKIFYKLNIKVILELPTYPYKKELNIYSPVLKFLMNIADNYVSKNIHKYVENIICFTNDEEIYGIKTISIENGIDLEKIEFTGYVKQKELNLIAVANVTFAHGYDRLINGLSEYYKNDWERDVYFHIVGESLEANKLKQLVNSLGLNEKVIFYGSKHGEELTDVYKKCQMGVASLGIYRIGLNQVSILKAREYTARGIPFILGYYDNSFINSNYVIKVPNNDEHINIKDILEFYDSCNILDTEIRNDAERLTWHSQIKKIMYAINCK